MGRGGKKLEDVGRGEKRWEDVKKDGKRWKSVDAKSRGYGGRGSTSQPLA